MSYWLGIDVGSSCIAAAVCRGEPGQPAQLAVVPLGIRSVVVRSVIYLAQDGEVVVGEAAERRAAADPGRVVGQLTRRIGDEAPMEIDGVRHSAADLLAQVITWVVERVAQRESGPARGVTLTHPAGWDPGKIQAVADALSAAQLPELRFCTGAQAAAASYSTRERVEVGATLAVYDLGGGSFETAVVRKTSGGTFAILGNPEWTETAGGTVFDDAVFGHVLAAVPALSESAIDASATARLQRSFALCRRECTEAKEALSAETEVTIPVLLPQLQSQVCLARTELEELIRPDVEHTVEALRRTLRSATLGPAQLDAVLLVGGSSQVPLVRRLLAAELGCPVVLHDDPQAAIAIGAALSGLPADQPAGTTVFAGAGAAAAALVSPGSEVPAPAGVASTASPGAPGQAAADAELPPWLAATPLDAGPSQDQGQPISSPRRTRLAVAGLLGLVIAGGAVSVPFIMSSHRDAIPPPAPAAGVPAPATSLRESLPPESSPLEITPQESSAPEPLASPTPAPGATGAPDSNDGESPGPLADAAPPVPTTTPGGAVRPRAGAAHSSPSRAKPAPAPPSPSPAHVPDWVSSARS